MHYITPIRRGNIVDLSSGRFHLVKLIVSNYSALNRKLSRYYYSVWLVAICDMGYLGTIISNLVEKASPDKNASNRNAFFSRCNKRNLRCCRNDFAGKGAARSG